MKDISGVPTSYGRRAAYYWFGDGLPAILFGLTLVVAAAWAFLWRMHAPEPWRTFDWVFVYACLVLYLVTERRVLDFLKSRITYLRTGYAMAPKESDWEGGAAPRLGLRGGPPAQENTTSFRLRTVGTVSVFFCLFSVGGSPPGRWFLPAAMPALAIFLYALNRRSEHSYPWWAALILALTGPLFLWIDVPEHLREPLPLLLAGAWLTALGVRQLMCYLSANSMRQPAERVGP